MKARAAPIALFALLLLVPLVLGIRTTHDLTCASGLDYFRDIAFARTIAEGRVGVDPAYIGERLWYNPGFPAMIAGFSRVTGLPLPAADVRIGAYVNLLGPIAFFVLLSMLFDGWVALAASMVFLFVLPATYPILTLGARAAPYTPWPSPSCFAQGLFYLALAAFLRARHSDRIRDHALVGAAIGVLFLTHTAPVAILGVIIGAVTIRRLARFWDADLAEPRLYRALIRAVAIVVPAIILAGPFLLPLWMRYHLRVIDPAPMAYVDDAIRLERLHALLWRELTSGWTLLALAGLLGIVTGKEVRRETRGILLLWLAGAFAFFLYGILYEGVRKAGISLLPVVPPHHFLYYCLVARAVLIAHGGIMLGHIAIGAAATLHRRISGIAERMGGLVRAGRVIGLAGVAVGAIAYLPGYPRLPDFVEERGSAKEMMARADLLAAMDWISSRTGRDDVVLTSASQGLTVCALAGRPVVSLEPGFSNPYVDGEARERSRAVMTSDLATGNEEEFRYWAEKYGVRTVLIAPLRRRPVRPIDLPFLEEGFRSGEVRIYRVLPRTGASLTFAINARTNRLRPQPIALHSRRECQIPPVRFARI